MRILTLALKDLIQILRDKKSLIFLVGMPIIFTLFMGFAYRSSSADKNADTRIRLAVVDSQPDAILDKMLLTRLEQSADLKITRMSESEALAAMHKGDTAGILIIPAGFSIQNKNNGMTQLNLIADASSQAQEMYQLLRGPVSQLASSVEIGKMSVEITGDPGDFVPSVETAWNKWDERGQLNPVRSEQASVKETADWTGGNPYNQASPGILVQFAIFGLVTSAQIIVQERKSRTMQRLMTTAMRPWEIITGHLLAMFTLTFLQTTMLVIFGQLVLNVNYLSEPLGTLLISTSLGLWVASMGLLIGVMAKGDDQVVLFAMIAMFLFSALGGTWFPLESAGGAFATVGRLMPSAWAMNGLQNILIRGSGLNSIWMPTAVLLIYTLGFFGLAVWKFRSSEM